MAIDGGALIWLLYISISIYICMLIKINMNGQYAYSTAMEIH